MAPARHVLAIDQGTTSTRAIVFDRAGAPVAQQPARARAALPARRLGRARSGDHLAGHGRGLSRGPGQGEAAARARRGARHHQPARDRGAVGAGERSAGAPRDRVAGPAHRRALPRAQRRRPRRPGQRAHRPGDRPVLLRDQARLAARRGRGRARRRPSAASWRSAPSIRSCSGGSPAARCTPPTRATPRAPCSTTSIARTGTTSCCGSCAFRGRFCRRSGTAARRSAPPRPVCSARRCRSPASPAISRRRPSARRASRRAC